MYRATCNNLCKANVLQRFVEKVLFSFPVMIITFMLSGCINWAHVIESNHLRGPIPEAGTMVFPSEETSPKSAWYPYVSVSSLFILHSLFLPPTASAGDPKPFRFTTVKRTDLRLLKDKGAGYCPRGFQVYIGSA